jgi:hypothetical protein
MCLASPGWRAKLAALARQAADSGADGICLEALSPGLARACLAPDHGHAVGETRSLLSLLGRELRPHLGEQSQLAADSCFESGLGAFDFLCAPEAGQDRLGEHTLRYGDHWEPIPLFQTVYHDYAPLFGPALSLAEREPIAPPAGPSQGRAGLQGSDLERFCFQVARAFVWGNQLLLADFEESQLLEEDNRHKVAFLAAALRAQNWAGGDFLWMGEFLGMLQVDSEGVEIQFRVGFSDSPPARANAGGRPGCHLPSGGRLLRQRVPRVLGSAWRGHQGAVLVALVNFTESDTQFLSRLDLRRLGVMVPLRAVGRTFSEAGDRAARLRTLGSDLAGRLPARSLTLVAL